MHTGLSSGYDNWLNQGNPHEDDDGSGDAQADAQADAEVQVMQCGYELAVALQEMVDADNNVSTTDVDALCRGGYDRHGKAAHELLAIILNANNAADIKLAAFELRDRLRAALGERIDEVAGDLLINAMWPQCLTFAQSRSRNTMTKQWPLPPLQHESETEGRDDGPFDCVAGVIAAAVVSLALWAALALAVIVWGAQ